MSLLTPDGGLLFWMFLCFGCVFVLLANYCFPVILRMVEERNVYIDSSIEAAEAAEQELAGIIREKERIVLLAQHEQRRILSEAAAQGNHLIEQAKEQAATECKWLLQEARLQIERERETAMQDFNRQVTLFSVSIAGKILGRELQTDVTRQQLIEQLLGEISLKH